MKPTKQMASQIEETSNRHSIKVKVIEQRNMHTSSESSSFKSQIITFEDQKGAHLKTILHNEQLDMFEHAIDDGMEYEISNAQVELLPGQMLGGPEITIYHIYINTNTTIRPFYGPNPTYSPKYIALTSIPREVSLDARCDVLGIVLHVAEKYHVPRHIGQPWNVSEVTIIDQSSEQIMIVTVWGDPAIHACMTLQSTAASFPVIGLTSLRMSYKKGFSLATTQQTFLDLNPKGAHAAVLRTWRQENIDFLTAKKQQISEVRQPETKRIIKTIQSLIQKKVQSTLQEEKHWLQVRLKEFEHRKVRLYLGCSQCGTGNNKDIGDTYNCTDCFTEDVISTPRVTVTFEATDETGSYFFTALTENAQKLLEIDAASLYSMLPQERECYFRQIERKIRSNDIYIQVVPANSLSRTQLLRWILKQVSLT